MKAPRPLRPGETRRPSRKEARAGHLAPAPVPAKNRILNAALDEFAERGFDGATTASVARRSGVTQPLIHYYFGSKEGLWRATLEKLGADLSMVLEAAAEDTRSMPAVEAIRVYIRRYVYFTAARPELSRTIAREATQETSRFRWLVDKYLRSLAEHFEQLIDRARQAGVLRDIPTQHAYFVLLGACSFQFESAALARVLYDKDPFAEDEVRAFADSLADIFLLGIVRPQS